jgi:hypothetical protein
LGRRINSDFRWLPLYSPFALLAERVRPVDANGNPAPGADCPLLVRRGDAQRPCFVENLRRPMGAFERLAAIQSRPELQDADLAIPHRSHRPDFASAFEVGDDKYISTVDVTA